jgi:transposase-like protein
VPSADPRDPGYRRLHYCRYADSCQHKVHYHRNLLTRVPKSAQTWVCTLVRTIFEQPDAASVRAQHAQVVSALEAKLPRAVEHLDAARDDILAFTAFPCELWRRIWSNNPLSVSRLSGDTILLAA